MNGGPVPATRAQVADARAILKKYVDQGWSRGDIVAAAHISYRTLNRVLGDPDTRLHAKTALGIMRLSERALNDAAAMRIEARNRANADPDHPQNTTQVREWTASDNDWLNSPEARALIDEARGIPA